MFTIIFYVALCTSPNICLGFEPVTWTANTHEDVMLSLRECEGVERGFMGMKAYKESDCYVIENEVTSI